MITKISFIVVNNFVNSAVAVEGLQCHATGLKIKNVYNDTTNKNYDTNNQQTCILFKVCLKFGNIFTLQPCLKNRLVTTVQQGGFGRLKY